MNKLDETRVLLHLGTHEANTRNSLLNPESGYVHCLFSPPELSDVSSGHDDCAQEEVY